MEVIVMKFYPDASL